MEKNINEKELQQFVDENINIVPKNQMKKFEAMPLKDKAAKIRFYQDIQKLKEDAKIKNSVINRVKEVFDKRHATVDDAKEVLDFCNEFISSFKQREIEKIDAEIQRLQEMKSSL